MHPLVGKRSTEEGLDPGEAGDAEDGAESESEEEEAPASPGAIALKPPKYVWNVLACLGSAWSTNLHSYQVLPIMSWATPRIGRDDARAQLERGGELR